MTTGGERFWPLVKRYRTLGLDPLKWIAGCSTEVEREEVVTPALASASDALATLGVSLHPQAGPDLFELRDLPAVPECVVVRPGASLPKAGRRVERANPLRAAVTMRVHQKHADFPGAFAGALVRALEGLPSETPSALRLNGPIGIGRLHAVATPHEGADFTLFDLYSAGRGAERGYTAVNCESLQIADATLDPLAEEHAATVVSSALAPLFAVGATQQAAVAPTIDAPGKKAADALAANFHRAARQFGLRLHDRAPVGIGKLFIGATVVAETDREVPNKHHYVKRGMQVTITRAFGELAPLATYLSCLSDPEQEGKLEAVGLTMAELARAREGSVRALTTPAREAGEVVHDFSPPFQEAPELKEHIAATFDVGPRGLFAFLDFARRFEVELQVRALPLAHEGISRFATAALLMDNATASAPGCVAIVAWPSVLDEVDRALAERGLHPGRVGEVVGRGRGTLHVPDAASANIASRRMLREIGVEPAAG